MRNIRYLILITIIGISTVVLPLTMSSCAHNPPLPKYARLYPANDEANLSGLLQAEYGGGIIKIVMPNGEILSGEYSTVSRESVNFGGLFMSMSGTYGFSSGSGMGMSINSPGSSPGIASLIGDKGTSMQCEYFVNKTGNGAGACKTSKGALYQVHF